MLSSVLNRYRVPLIVQALLIPELILHVTMLSVFLSAAHNF